jgi:hypothetical protein
MFCECLVLVRPTQFFPALCMPTKKTVNISTCFALKCNHLHGIVCCCIGYAMDSLIYFSLECTIVFTNDFDVCLRNEKIDLMPGLTTKVGLLDVLG